MEKLFDIIHEDANLLVVHKPADLVCHPTKGDEYSSLISRARIYLHRRDEFHESQNKKSKIKTCGSQSLAEISPQELASISVDQRFPTPHLIHRLDRETSGLVIIAKNAATARDLGRIWETREVRKEYLAIVHGHIQAEQGIIDAPLGKDIQSKVAIKDCVRPDGSPAQTEFQVLKRFFHTLEGTNMVGRSRFIGRAGDQGFLSPVDPKRTSPTLTLNPTANQHPASGIRDLVSGIRHQASPYTLLRVTPRSGRKHQIRIHLAHLGHPIVGDKIYGHDEDAYLALVEGRMTDAHRHHLILPHHALHAERITFTWNGTVYDFTTPPETWFNDFLSSSKVV